MSPETSIAIALAAGFTLGCVVIQRAGRHANAVTLVLAMLLGLTASLVTSRLGSLHPTQTAEAGHFRVHMHLLH